MNMLLNDTMAIPVFHQNMSLLCKISTRNYESWMFDWLRVVVPPLKQRNFDISVNRFVLEMLAGIRANPLTISIDLMFNLDNRFASLVLYPKTEHGEYFLLFGICDPKNIKLLLTKGLVWWHPQYLFKPLDSVGKNVSFTRVFCFLISRTWLAFEQFCDNSLKYKKNT